MKYNEIIKELKSGVFRPIYFLMGEEPYNIDQITRYIEQHALPEDKQSFNQSVLYGADTDVNTIIGEAKRYPMMADRVVIVVREAQKLRDIESLASYVDQPQPSTVLVVAYKYKKLDKRKKLYKLLSNQSVIYESKKIYDNHVPAWVGDALRANGRDSNPKARMLIAESLGTDLGRIDQELQKLELVLNKGQAVDEDVVEQHIGISKDYNNFELNNALGEMDFAKAIKIQQYFAANPKDNPLVVTVSTLFGFFSKLMIMHQAKDKSPRALASLLGVNPFFIKDFQTAAKHYNLKKLGRIISYIRECDTRSKGINNSSVPDGELLRELIFKIVYV
ncbi:MAG: DNA polymerase III subunit delta [Owenweeksia sp.]|nr:DNA polymerase III subunit delta [Owenweeksia sp.]